MQYHPITNKPVFTVHPCNTAEAMAEMGDRFEVTLENYMSVWVGLVGGCVGLHVPARAVSVDHK